MTQHIKDYNNTVHYSLSLTRSIFWEIGRGENDESWWIHRAPADYPVEREKKDTIYFVASAQHILRW